MAIAFDAAASVGGASVASLTTASWTIAGANRYLHAAVGISGSPPTVSAVKWGGSGGTDLTAVDQSGVVQSFMRLELWGLIAPTAQTSTLYASFSGTADECCIGGVSYTGVDQSTPRGTSAHATGNGSGTPPTVGVTASSGDLVVDGVYSLTDALTVGAGQTERVNQANTGDITQLGMSEEAGTGTVTMSWGHSSTLGNWEWATAGVALKPVGGGGSNTTITPPVGSLALTGKQVSISILGAIVPGTGSLVLSGKQPIVIAPVNITPAAGALILTGRQASIASSGNIVATPGVASLVFTGYQPVQELATPAPLPGALSLTGYQPVQQLGIMRVPGVGTLTITGQGAVRSLNFDLKPGVGALVLAGATPGVQTSGASSSVPNPAALILTGYQPQLSIVLASPTITPLLGSLVLTGRQAGTKIELGNPVTVVPGVGALVLTGYQVSRAATLPEGFYATTFINDATVVPASARYIGGAAFAQTGERYVCYWPADNKVVFLGGFAHRHDGAMVIDPAGAIAGKIQGLALTFRGELVTTLSARELDHNGFPLLQTGKVCVTNQS